MNKNTDHQSIYLFRKLACKVACKMRVWKDEISYEPKFFICRYFFCRRQVIESRNFRIATLPCFVCTHVSFYILFVCLKRFTHSFIRRLYTPYWRQSSSLIITDDFYSKFKNGLLVIEILSFLGNGRENILPSWKGFVGKNEPNFASSAPNHRRNCSYVANFSWGDDPMTRNLFF